ncbi:hypothetical protein D3C78_1635700 [compost metagenome]
MALNWMSSGATWLTPVTLRSGCCRFLISPALTGSVTSVNTMGVLRNGLATLLWSCRPASARDVGVPQA